MTRLVSSRTIYDQLGLNRAPTLIDVRHVVHLAQDGARRAALLAEAGVRVMSKLAKALVLLGAPILYSCITATAIAANSNEQVLFVCEHGNVKSLMAASYFNQLAAERNLPLRAMSRGVAPDSTSVPPAIVAGLKTEGIEVDNYRPQAVGPDDASQSRYVVTIGTDLPRSAQPVGVTVEQWNDVPAASTNYAGARDSLRAHVRNLVERLSRPATE